MSLSNRQPGIIGFFAYSGTGKTTLLTQVLPLLNELGLKVGVIKHSHHDFAIDQPGKDSHRLRAAGASPVMIVSNYRRAIITELDSPKEPVTLAQQIKYLDNNGLDLILVEGFSQEQYPKIELYRQALNKPFRYPQDDTILAVAADCPLDLPVHLTYLDLNQPHQIAKFIVTWNSNTHD